MRKFLLFLISLLIGVMLFVWIGKLVGWQEIKNAFLVFTGWQGMVILGLTILTALVGTWKWKEILKSGGTNISFGTLLRTYLASFSIRYFAPVIIIGAELFQGYILKERNLVPWSKGMASVVIDRILEWTANLVVIFFGVLIFLLMIGLPPMKLMLIFGGVFLVFASGIIYFYFKTLKRESIAKAFAKILKQQLDSQPLEIEKEIFNFFKLKKLSMWKAFGFSFLRAVVMYFRAWLLILFLGKEISGLAVFSILGFTYLAVMIPIPTALGSHEAIQTLVFNSLDLGLPTATAFTMIIRGAEFLIALAGVIILFRLGLIFLKNFLFKRLEKLTNQNDF
ncbi:MAG: lysylphosphatidylglycerol synthase transmembrane domain-containing protein [Patescibacteria group bacterium]|nr:lysylphosphatidylglycerol synthase transmembrane domain-containing protein [Patescibacteria group bacterium]